jgi:hypothetical protein
MPILVYKIIQYSISNYHVRSLAQWTLRALLKAVMKLHLPKKRQLTCITERHSDSQGRIWSMHLIKSDPLAIYSYVNALRYVTCM